MFVVSCQRAAVQEKSIYEKKITDTARENHTKNSRRGGKNSAKSSTKNSAKNQRLFTEISVFDGVTLSEKVIGQKMKVGQKFSYDVALTDTRKKVKKNQKVSLGVVTASFPGLKLVGKKKSVENKKNRKKIVYRYTFLPRKAGKHKITPSPVVVKKGKKPTKVSLDGVFFVVHPAKKSWFGWLVPYEWWKSFQKKSQSWLKSSWKWMKSPESWLKAPKSWAKTSWKWLKSPESWLKAPKSWLKKPRAWLRNNEFIQFVQKKFSPKPMDNTVADIVTLAILGAVSYFVFKWTKRPINKAVGFVKNKFKSKI